MKSFVVIVLSLVNAIATAKEPIVPLPASTAASLSGKTLVVTRHEKPAFVAATAGKATFALVGAGAMVVEGNRLVKGNAIADPADIIEAQLVPALVKHNALLWQPSSTRVVTTTKAAGIAKAQADADVVLDIESIGWNFNYYPTHWGSYWTGYVVRVRLIDAKTAALLAGGSCGANTLQHPNPPSKAQLLQNDARLLKDLQAGFGWACAHFLAKAEFNLPDDSVAAIPEELKDPLASMVTQAGSDAADTSPSSPR